MRTRTALGRQGRALALIAGIALAAHSPIFFNELIWDDVSLIETHPQLGRWDFFGEAWSRDYGLEFGNRKPNGYYRPLFVTMLNAERMVFGEWAAGYRLGSLAGLIGLAALAAGLVYRMARRSAPAILAGCLIAAHPVLTEPTGIVAARPDLLIHLALGGALWLGLAAAGRGNGRGRFAALALGSFGAALAALLFKEAALFSLAGIGWALFAVGRGKRVRAMVVLGSWAAAGALALGLRARAAGVEYETAAALGSPFSQSGAQAALWAGGVSLRSVVLPAPARYMRMNPYMEIAGSRAHKGLEGEEDWSSQAQTAMGALALAALAALGWAAWRRRPLLAGLLGWTAGGIYPLLLASGVGLPFSERYIPLAPLAMLAALGLARRFRGMREFPWARREDGSPAYAAIAAWLYIGACVAMSLGGSAKAMNGYAFWHAMERDDPEFFAPHAALSTLFFRDGLWEEMERHAKRAIELAPDNAVTREVGQNMGMRALLDGDAGEALRWFDWALEYRPDDVECLKSRAVALFQAGRREDARRAIAETRQTWTDRADLAFIEARIWVESPETGAAEAAKVASAAAELGSEIPADWLTAEGVERVRRERTEK